jgi:hypothetical protein
VPQVQSCRQLTLLLFAALCSSLAFALDGRYEGLLEPDSRDPAIPIVVELAEPGMFLTGTVKTSAPYKASAPVESGRNDVGQCTLYVVLSRSVTLRMEGSCDATSFNGTYRLWDTQKRTITRGSFRLPRKGATPAPVNLESKRVGATSAACLKANTQCLLACPRGDDNVEFMCSNHCRTKLGICKRQIKKTLPEAE